MYSKKEFGQNFLINNTIAEKIVKSLDIKNTDYNIIYIRLMPATRSFYRFIKSIKEIS